jgi:hypothetical protein
MDGKNVSVEMVEQKRYTDFEISGAAESKQNRESDRAGLTS